MNLSLGLVLLILAGCVGMFAIGRPRMDVVALLALVLLTLTGIVTMPEALTGFSDSNVVLIATLFVIGEGLVRTGVASQLGAWLATRAGGSETRLIVLLMLTVAGLGSVMSSTGVVAVFIPVVLSVAARMKVSPSRLMMPLSFAGLISGMLTLVGTPPNMVMDSALKNAGKTGLAFFSFTPVGLTVLVCGVGYLLIARRWFASRNEATASAQTAGVEFSDFIRDYGLATHERRLLVRPSSPLIGQTLAQLQPRRKHQANVIAIERRNRLGTTLIHPRAETELQANDVLFVDAVDSPESPDVSPRELAEVGLEALPLTGQYFSDQAHDLGLAEVMILPDSALAGKSVRDSAFRSQHGVHVIGLRRRGAPLPAPVIEEKLTAGDLLLVSGPWKAIRQLQRGRRDFLLLSLPEEATRVVPARRQAPFALLSLGVMVALMITGWVPNVLAGLIGCLLMGLGRCVDLDSAYKSIHWSSLILIVGMMPFSIALEKTGGVDLAATGFLQVVGAANPHLILASLFLFTALTGLFISNTATAVLMAPIALSIAEHLGASPQAFAMTVALAASAAFMTPVSSPVNTLVMGPGHYRFSDFVKIGVPFTVLVLIITVLLVPWLFPLYAK